MMKAMLVRLENLKTFVEQQRTDIEQTKTEQEKTKAEQEKTKAELVALKADIASGGVVVRRSATSTPTDRHYLSVHQQPQAKPGVHTHVLKGLKRQGKQTKRV